MKTFLTLLVAITSLSAYTLVGVHAGCAICPETMFGWGLSSQCVPTGGDITRCEYQEHGTGSSLWCYFDSNGTLDISASSYYCSGGAETRNTCPNDC
ncbi:hypothetical protein BDN67DRAFT_230463 [Paxillus ammoniavirescens]|nr:hypothetical protein BDN67DRAFT_230463 [Paxillus ammoniavirescens]